MTGKRMPHGLPSGPTLAGPDEPMQLPSTLAQTTKCRAGSIGCPAPTIRVHQPGLPVTGCALATCWSPVSAWQIRIAGLAGSP